MPKLPRISSKKAIKTLKHLGFKQVRQTGSHVVLKKMTKESTVGCVVPLHKELKIGTLGAILRQARVSVDEFIENL